MFFSPSCAKSPAIEEKVNQLAMQQANFHYERVIALEAQIEEEKRIENPSETLRIMEHLLLAIDNGSDEAGVKFLERVRLGFTGELFNINQALQVLKEDADRNNGTAAFVYGRYHAGHSISAKPFLGTEKISPEKREAIAIQYLEKAMEYGHERARTTLFTAYKIGTIGCIAQSQSRWQTFCEKWIEKSDIHSQALALDYGAQLCGINADGTPVTPFEQKKIKCNFQKGLTYLRHAMNKPNTELAFKAILCILQVQPDSNLLHPPRGYSLS